MPKAYRQPVPLQPDTANVFGTLSSEPCPTMASRVHRQTGAPPHRRAASVEPLARRHRKTVGRSFIHKAVTRNTGRRECRPRHATSAQRHAPQGHRVVVVHANHLVAPVLSSLAWRHSSKLSKTQSVRYVLTRTLHLETVSSERLVRSSNGLQPQAQ